MRCFQIMRWWCSNLGQGSLLTWAPSLITNFILTLPPNLYQPILWIYSFTPLYTTAPTISIVRIHSPSLLHPIPTSSTRAKRRPPGRRPHPPPARLLRSSIHPVLRACVCRHAMWLWALTICHPFSFPGPCQPNGGSPVLGPSAPLCPCLYLPGCFAISRHLRYLLLLNLMCWTDR